MFDYNNQYRPYGSQVLGYGDPRRSPNPLRALAAHVRWEFVLGFFVVMGFFTYTLVNGDPNFRGPGTLGLVVTGWVFSLCLHEFAHAATAYLGGDHSDGTRSYLSFNPLRYVNPLLSIILPLLFIIAGGIALPGGAVYVRRDLVRNRAWQSAISLAGPLMNLICLGVLGLIFKTGLVSVSQQPYLAAALALLALFQAFSIVLNLLPIPPLDGFGVIAPWLPRNVQAAAYSFGAFSVLLIFLILFRGGPLTDGLRNAIDSVLSGVGINPLLAEFGLYDFQFWTHQ